jgi:hypothetical protein
MVHTVSSFRKIWEQSLFISYGVEENIEFFYESEGVSDKKAFIPPP